MASHSYAIQSATGFVHATGVSILDHINLWSEASKKSLDVFLQPLTKELKDLWLTGVRTYDCSTKTNFTMRAMLLWTISDFHAYGMLSGWTAHERLSCPHCNGMIYAF